MRTIDEPISDFASHNSVDFSEDIRLSPARSRSRADGSKSGSKDGLFPASDRTADVDFDSDLSGLLSDGDYVPSSALVVMKPIRPAVEPVRPAVEPVGPAVKPSGSAHLFIVDTPPVGESKGVVPKGPTGGVAPKGTTGGVAPKKPSKGVASKKESPPSMHDDLGKKSSKKPKDKKKPKESQDKKK